MMVFLYFSILLFSKGGDAERYRSPPPYHVHENFVSPTLMKMDKKGDGDNEVHGLDDQDFLDLSNDGTEAGEPINCQGQVFYCQTCRTTCSGPKGWESHINGYKHRKKSAAVHSSVKMDWAQLFICRLCDIKCVGNIPFAAHISGHKHKRAYELQIQRGRKIPEAIVPWDYQHDPYYTSGKPMLPLRNLGTGKKTKKAKSTAQNLKIVEGDIKDAEGQMKADDMDDVPIQVEDAGDLVPDDDVEVVDMEIDSSAEENNRVEQEAMESLFQEVEDRLCMSEKSKINNQDGRYNQREKQFLRCLRVILSLDDLFKPSLRQNIRNLMAAANHVHDSKKASCLELLFESIVINTLEEVSEALTVVIENSKSSDLDLADGFENLSDAEEVLMDIHEFWSLMRDLEKEHEKQNRLQSNKEANLTTEQSSSYATQTVLKRSSGAVPKNWETSAQKEPQKQVDIQKVLASLEPSLLRAIASMKDQNLFRSKDSQSDITQKKQYFIPAAGSLLESHKRISLQGSTSSHSLDSQKIKGPPMYQVPSQAIPISSSSSISLHANPSDASLQELSSPPSAALESRSKTNGQGSISIHHKQHHIKARESPFHGAKESDTVNHLKYMATLIKHWPSLPMNVRVKVIHSVSMLEKTSSTVLEDIGCKK
ncbi:unnamed protein product [Darwinula stevensoni]|uniref:U1-type domain-containing protein n=1 Tax=Darwinula stevensoni TaxID=69355 RepID=A0A7R8X694_9CRUS|nr:unnamed protein product [Darwinula stevensoni]CAG0886649.1 unnamed protein product [Darwinula stevensoni]